MTLALVQSTASAAATPQPWQWSGADPADAPPPTVLSTERLHRLRSANEASRRLRAMGLQVLHIDINADIRPVLRIFRDLKTDLRPLLDAALPNRAWWSCCPLSRIGHVCFCGALISWDEV